MKKNTFVRIIPDLSFLLLSSLITVSLFNKVSDNFEVLVSIEIIMKKFN